NIVQLDIEPHFCAGREHRAHDLRAFCRVKLKADFEKRNLIAQLLHERERFFFCRYVQRDDDFVSSVCHVERSRDISVFRPTARDSSTSLGMTEQIAGYASPRTCEDQFINENSRPPQRRLS